MPGGSFLGALAVTQLADRIGRKPTIIISGIFWVIGSILQCASINRGMLVVGRIISGLAVGLASAVVPIYQAEITAPAIRGRIVSLQQWSITWGILIQYFIQFGCSYINGVASFRIPWGLQMIPAIVLSLGMTLFPESPRWLFDKGREDEALQVLADLHGGGDESDSLVQLEYAEIKQQVEFERKEGAKSYLDLLKPGNPRRVLLGCALQMWSQLSGMNIMMYVICIVSVLNFNLTDMQVLHCLRLPRCWPNRSQSKPHCRRKSGPPLSIPILTPASTVSSIRPQCRIHCSSYYLHRQMGSPPNASSRNSSYGILPVPRRRSPSEIRRMGKRKRFTYAFLC